MGGHSDVVGGAFVTSDKEIYDTVKFYQNAAGAVPGPWDSWLVLRGLKTLKVRILQHQENAFTWPACWKAIHRWSGSITPA